jgi:hypothetical protein
MGKGKIILDLCGGTGAWSKPYREAGYDVRLVTLPEWDVCRVQLVEGGLLLCKTDNTLRVVRCSDVYGIFAAPPCTEFSIAKNAAPRDFINAMKVVEACMRIVWHCRIYGHPKFWAMENPRGFLRQFMGKPTFTFYQWQFGTSTVKPTDIWGYFNAPKPTVREMPENIIVHYGKRTHSRDLSNPPCPEEYKHLILDRAALRAITPKGFADAFFNANK